MSGIGLSENQRKAETAAVKSEESLGRLKHWKQLSLQLLCHSGVLKLKGRGIIESFQVIIRPSIMSSFMGYFTFIARIFTLRFLHFQMF